VLVVCWAGVKDCAAMVCYGVGGETYNGEEANHGQSASIASQKLVVLVLRFTYNARKMNASLVNLRLQLPPKGALKEQSDSL
jgi:hypothetical protein